MGKIIQGPWGVIDISKEVIAKIAGIATMECFGIVGMVSSRRISDGLSELLGKEALAKGVEVTISPDDVLSIKINVVVSYGLKISIIANNVVDRVKYALENTIGTEVANVEVNVLGVRIID